MASTVTIPGLAIAAQDIINSALRLIIALQSGEVPSAAESQDALFILNQMIDAWNAEQLMIFVIQREVFSLVSGQQVYTMGPGGNFNTARPAKIDRISVINFYNPPQPLELPLDYITQQEWQNVPVKSIQSALPQLVWDDQAFPLRNLSYWPIPNSTPLQTAIYDWVALSYFQNLTNQFIFPPGYVEAIRYNLALRLAPEWGATARPDVVALAEQSKSRVESINAPIVDLRCDPALVTANQSLYNWITDMPVRR